MQKVNFAYVLRYIYLYSDEKPSNEEIEVLVKSLNYQPDPTHTEQLKAEKYLNELLKGNELKFFADKTIGKLKGNSYLSFNLNPRLKRIYETMCNVITCRGLNLEFEYEHEKWAFNPNGEEEIPGKKYIVTSSRINFVHIKILGY